MSNEEKVIDKLIKLCDKKIEVINNYKDFKHEAQKHELNGMRKAYARLKQHLNKYKKKP